jgi:hypothetical protein
MERKKEVTRRLCSLLATVWTAPFSTKSDRARLDADYIAIAAEAGLITTRTLDGEYGHRWMIAPKGLRFLWTTVKRKS